MAEWVAFGSKLILNVLSTTSSSAVYEHWLSKLKLMATDNYLHTERYRTSNRVTELNVWERERFEAVG